MNLDMNKLEPLLGTIVNELGAVGGACASWKRLLAMRRRRTSGRPRPTK